MQHAHVRAYIELCSCHVCSTYSRVQINECATLVARMHVRTCTSRCAHVCKVSKVTGFEGHHDSFHDMQHHQQLSEQRGWLLEVNCIHDLVFCGLCVTVGCQASWDHGFDKE